MSPFLTDDYAEVEATYFAELRRRGEVDADPSGWRGNWVEAGQWAPLPQLRASDLVPYYIDEGEALARYKELIATLLRTWDGYDIRQDEFTLCPSGASTSLVTLATLKHLGVGRIIFETPSYFASIDQATQLGLACDLVPTYRRDAYALPPLEPWIREGSHVAVWLTQPRASLGFNQPAELIAHLLEQLPSTSYVVVDEATEQTLPLHLGQLAAEHRAANLIRLRSFTKGMGLNGLRLASILHPARLRAPFVHCLEFIGASVDAHSLNAVGMLAVDINRFRTMLEAANNQVNALRGRAERLVAGSWLSVNHLTNGYIGTMVADLTALGDDQAERRTKFLEGCRRVHTPVMLGASSYVAVDVPTEAIRLNFFRPPDDLLRGITNILSIWPAF